jgi:hypothetical protein
MSTITNGKYAQFSADVKTLIERAAKIYVTISSDNAGSNIISDNQNNFISKKLIIGMNYTYPDTLPSGQQILGNYVITFSDGCTFTVSDTATNFWYCLEGIEPYVYKQLV